MSALAALPANVPMNDAEAEDQKARVLAMAEPWMEALWLKWWNIDWRWHRGRLDSEDDATAMACAANWRYAEAVISVDLTRVAGWDDAELEKVVVHELMHPILHEMRSWTPDEMGHEERVASWLQRALMTVRDRAREQGGEIMARALGPGSLDD